MRRSATRCMEAVGLNLAEAVDTEQGLVHANHLYDVHPASAQSERLELRDCERA